MCRTSIARWVSLFDVFELKIVADGSENTERSGNSESQGSLQAAVCSADLDSLLETGHLSASGVFQNCLSEELKVVNSQRELSQKLWRGHYEVEFEVNGIMCCR